MKKIIGMILGALLAGALVGCTEDTTVEDYQALEAEFHALGEEQELTLTSDVRFELLGVENAVLYISTTVTQADGGDEAMTKHIVRDQDGAMISEMEMIVVGDSGYLDMEGAVSRVIYVMLYDEMVLEALGFLEMDPKDLTTEDILGGSYTHLQSTQEMLQEMEEERQERRGLGTGIHEVFATEMLEEKLSIVPEDTFRIEITGESVGDTMEVYIEAVLEEMNLDEVGFLRFDLMEVSDIDEDLLLDLEEDFLDWVSGGNLEDSEIVIERSRDGEDTFYQKIELYVPEKVSITMDARIVVGESRPITAPDRYLAADEFEERLERWLMDLVEEAMFQMVENGPYDDIDGDVDEEILSFIQYDARYWFEQFIVAEMVASLEVEIIDSLQGGEENALREDILSAWGFITRIVISENINSLGVTGLDHVGLEDITDDIRMTFGLGDDHILDSWIEEIDENTNAFIFQLVDIETPRTSIYMAIAYNDVMGLQIFTLEDIQGVSRETGEFMFCFVAVDSRGSFYSIEGNRLAFIDAIYDVMVNLVEPAISQNR